MLNGSKIILYLYFTLNIFLDVNSLINPFIKYKRTTNINVNQDKNRYNPFSKKYYQELSDRKKNNTENDNSGLIKKKYFLTIPSYIEELR